MTGICISEGQQIWCCHWFCGEALKTSHKINVKLMFARIMEFFSAAVLFLFQVFLVTDTCSSASSCDECVSVGDPLCGWCILEGKCSRSSSCMDSESTGRYLTQGQQDSCIDRITIEPSQFVQDLSYEV